MRNYFFSILIILLLSVPSKTWAWGQQGHRIVGEIAYKHLSAKAKAAIQNILGVEPMALASTWADFVRSDTGYKYLDSWHYIDFDKDLTYQEMKTFLKSDTAHDAYTAIIFLKNQLQKKNLSREKKIMYLKLLIHIVGDVHQPLHVSKSGDMGGNDIKVSWFGQPTNLHSVWDSKIIDNEQLSYTEYSNALDHPTFQLIKKLQVQPVSQWLYDSYTISNQLHKEITEPNAKLSYVYVYQHLHIVNDQLLKGGIHLAGLLNEIFH